MNKEVSDALYMLLHCALKDKEFETQKEQFEIVYDYIEKLNNKIDNTIEYLIHLKTSNAKYNLNTGHLRKIIKLLKENDGNE